MNQDRNEARFDRFMSFAKGCAFTLYALASIGHSMEVREALVYGMKPLEVEKIVWGKALEGNPFYVIEAVAGIPARTFTYYSDYARKKVAEDPEFYSINRTL
ncbi:hypothetical protein HYZ41_01315 [archaeon]|nr:hypothetical protein [archaeon]